MTTNSHTQKIGRKAEQLALDYLIEKGYSLQERNYRFRRSEIDLILLQDQTLVFVEVKYRRNSKYGHPEEFVSANQQRSIIEGADQYLYDHNWMGNIRFDIIAIDAQLNLMHFEDAFY